MLFGVNKLISKRSINLSQDTRMPHSRRAFPRQENEAETNGTNTDKINDTYETTDAQGTAKEKSFGIFIQIFEHEHGNDPIYMFTIFVQNILTNRHEHTV